MDSNKNHSSNGNGAEKCPFMGGSIKRTVAGKGPSNRDWWPNALNLDILRQHSSLSDPMDEGFDYGEEFKKLDLGAIKQDLFDLMTGLSGLVACGLWTLWSLLHPHGLAQCRYLPDDGWKRRKWFWFSSVSHLLTAGLTTPTSTRHVCFYGQLSRSTERKFPGQI